MGKIAREMIGRGAVGMGRHRSNALLTRAWRPGILAGLTGTTVLIMAVARLRGRAEVVAGARHSPPLVPYALQIDSGVYLLGGLSPSAAYSIETPEGLVLVDSGLQSDAGVLKSELERLGLDWRRVRAVLITHAHLDHSGGAEHLRVAAGAKVYAGRGDAGVLKAGGPREAFFSAFSLHGGELHPTRVDVELKGGESIEFGDVRFRALATPGHTPGSICYLMERAGLRALFTGDVISMLVGDEKSHVRIAKALGTYAAYLPPRYRGDARAYLGSLRQLRAMPVPDLMLPGHPRGDPTPEYPRLSQSRWEELLNRGIAEMTALQARYEADGADFLDGIPKRLLPDLYYLGDFRDAAVYGFFASSKFFLVDAPGGPGLLAFLKDRLQRLGLEPAEPAAVLLTSSDDGATAGLKELVEACRPQVVVSSAGLPILRRSCLDGTSFLAAEELPRRGWFEVTPIPLRGRGIAPIAYRIKWAGKTVLFSGRIPIDQKPWTDAALFADISRSREATLDYLFSVYRLGEARPDLWLPAVPVDGRNANLYDDEWPHLLDDNYRVGYRSLMRR
jgi:glyoxylase-like metal-dependent hydrolase (beta-lactamase superfamily II)